MRGWALSNASMMDRPLSRPATQSRSSSKGLAGVIGYFLKIYGFQVGPVILGMILGLVRNKSCRQAMIFAKGKIGQFAGEFFTAPLSLIILMALTLTIVSQTQWLGEDMLRRSVPLPNQICLTR